MSYNGEKIFLSSTFVKRAAFFLIFKENSNSLYVILDLVMLLI